MKVPIAVPTLGQAEHDAVLRPLTSGWVAQGPEVAAFEEEFAAYCEVQHAVACTSGTSALHLVLAALDIGPGDDVIVPGFTWVSCANVVELLGARAVLCDVDPRTFMMKPDHLEAAWTPQTKAVMPVHLFGAVASLNGILDLCQKRGVHVIEDAACAAGSRHMDKHAGTFGTAGTFSFHPRKVLTAGEGGMVITKSGKIAKRIRSLRNHGADGTMPGAIAMADYVEPAWNYRMTDIQAAILRAQLSQLDQFVARRREIAAHYDNALIDLPVAPQRNVPGTLHSYQSYVLRVDDRDELAQHLAQREVQTRQGTHAIHLLAAYRNRYAPDDLPGCLDAHDHTLALPLFPALTDAQIQHVIGGVRSFFE
jgi:dTDP-4-amino-4,6-dideoxygalactose transaminase